MKGTRNFRTLSADVSTGVILYFGNIYEKLSKAFFQKFYQNLNSM